MTSYTSSGNLCRASGGSDMRRYDSQAEIKLNFIFEII
jgi:hypothetical protein